MVVCVILRIRIKLKDFGWYAKEKMMTEIYSYFCLYYCKYGSNFRDNRTVTKQNLVSALCLQPSDATKNVAESINYKIKKTKRI